MNLPGNFPRELVQMIHHNLCAFYKVRNRIVCRAWREALTMDAAWSCYYLQKDWDVLSARKVSLWDDFCSQVCGANSFLRTHLLYAPFKFHLGGLMVKNLKADRFVGLSNDALEVLCSSDGVACVADGTIDMEALAELAPAVGNAILSKRGLYYLREGFLTLGDVARMSSKHMNLLVSKKGFRCYRNFTLEDWMNIPESCLEIATCSVVTDLLCAQHISCADVVNGAIEDDPDTLLQYLRALVSSRESHVVDEEQKCIQENVVHSPLVARWVPLADDSFSENISEECGDSEGEEDTSDET